MQGPGCRDRVHLPFRLTHERPQFRQHIVLQNRGCVDVNPKNSNGLCEGFLTVCNVCGVCSQFACVCHYMYLYLLVLHQCVVVGVGVRAHDDGRCG